MEIDQLKLEEVSADNVCLSDGRWATDFGSLIRHE